MIMPDTVEEEDDKDTSTEWEETPRFIICGRLPPFEPFHLEAPSRFEKFTRGMKGLLGWSEKKVEEEL